MSTVFIEFCLRINASKRNTVPKKRYFKSFGDCFSNFPFIRAFDDCFAVFGVKSFKQLLFLINTESIRSKRLRF